MVAYLPLTQKVLVRAKAGEPRVRQLMARLTISKIVHVGSTPAAPATFLHPLLMAQCHQLFLHHCDGMTNNGGKHMVIIFTKRAQQILFQGSMSGYDVTECLLHPQSTYQDGQGHTHFVFGAVDVTALVDGGRRTVIDLTHS